MANRRVKRIVMAAAAAAIVAGALVVFRPEPKQVEAARATRGPMRVTIDEEGETRARDRFTLAAPVAGRLSRIALREGDEVGPETVIATISPVPLDPRELAEIRARVDSAEARLREARQLAARWESDYAQAERELNRARRLAAERLVADRDLELAESKEAASREEVGAAKHRLDSAQAEVERERAGLMSLEAGSGQGKTVAIRAPARCRILRILEKSERVVASGTPLLVLSNPRKIEIVVDLLSSDAVKVKPGADVAIENWGGSCPLRARVRTVEPYGFTKVSALGIEEQRVNVIADFIDSPDGLGDGYRVDAGIVLWESASVLKIPASALFRSGARWQVFAIENGRAQARYVEVGHRNAAEAEILSGLQEGAAVVLHPASDLKPGDRLRARQEPGQG